VETEVQTDIDGDARDASPDLGADEYVHRVYLPLAVRNFSAPTEVVKLGILWPLALKGDAYTNIACDQEFLVFRAGTEDQLDCADGCVCVDASKGITTTPPECEDLCNCDSIGPHVTPANRAWLQFPEPDEGYPDDCAATAHCGQAELECWIRNDYPGAMTVGDCVPGAPGVRAAAEDDINSRIGEIVNIVLWDRPCCYYTDEGCDDPPPLGDCPGTPYRVADFGRVEVIGWDVVDIPKCGDPSQACQSGRNLQVVRLRKICNDP
jgi:hypothetical protein